MEQEITEGFSAEKSKNESASLSYKFQRLREKLREAVSTGELAGKLPGERALAKRFHVNAKTLSKALTDLAAEGLLDRSIGRGTYVKGSAPSVAAGKRWLIVCDPQQVNWEIVELLRTAQPDLETITDVTSLRPSFLNQFSAVVDLAENTPDTFIREMVVRNVAVVLVGKEPRIYSTHAVVFDGPLAVVQLGRKLALSGHRTLAAVEPARCSVVADNLRQTLARYTPDAVVNSCFPQDAVAMVENGVTAFVCHCVTLAAEVKSQLEKAAIAVPQHVSILALGSTPDQPPVSGAFISRTEKANAIVQLLKDQQNSHPTTIWLAGQLVERGTFAPRLTETLHQAEAPADVLAAESFGHQNEFLTSVAAVATTR